MVYQQFDPAGDRAEGGKQLRLQILPNSTPVPNWFFDKVLALAGLRDAESGPFLSYGARPWVAEDADFSL